MIKFKENLRKSGPNRYVFTDVYGEDHEIELERIPYTDSDCFVELFDLDIDSIEDPVIKLQIEGLDSMYECNKYDCEDWDYVNDEIERND